MRAGGLNQAACCWNAPFASATICLPRGLFTGTPEVWCLQVLQRFSPTHAAMMKHTNAAGKKTTSSTHETRNRPQPHPGVCVLKPLVEKHASQIIFLPIPNSKHFDESHKMTTCSREATTLVCTREELQGAR